MGRRDNEANEADDFDSDGLRPDEQEGPDASEASPERCEYHQGELTEGVTESSFEMSDELHDAFPIEPIPVAMAADGLPDMSVGGNPDDALATPYTYETQLCIEDDRQFVELFSDEFRLEFRLGGTDIPWEIIECRKSSYRPDGVPRDRRTFPPAEVVERWGKRFVLFGGKLIPVRPLRERCIHLKQQVFSNDSIPNPADENHQIVFRVCGARRSNGGAYMSLGNEGIYACDFREPFDVPSARLQARKDKKKLQDRPDLLFLPIFNLAGDAVQLENKTK